MSVRTLSSASSARVSASRTLCSSSESCNKQETNVRAQLAPVGGDGHAAVCHQPELTMRTQRVVYTPSRTTEHTCPIYGAKGLQE
ncbi:hypothetical protein J6590_019704 [Homalodisca vitripennis]|nr:hypothetical protein J6590_019704 [Homalodisca vitripennis]